MGFDNKIITEPVEDIFEQDSKKSIAESSFMDAICDGLLVVNKDFMITSQNFTSKAKMGDLVGQVCHVALERSEKPCESCPMVVKPAGEFEVSLRNICSCSGSGDDFFKVKIYPVLDYNNDIIGITEVYPEMIDRRSIMDGLQDFEQELFLLKDAVDNVCNAMTPDDAVSFSPVK